MRRFFNFVSGVKHWIFLLLLSAILASILLAILVSAGVLIFAPADAFLRVDKIGLAWVLGMSLVILLPGAIAGIYYWRSYRRTAQQKSSLIRLYSEGFGDIDYALVAKLFHDCQEVRMYPLTGGFSGSQIFQVDSWDRQGMPQRRSVLKLGPRRKIEAEEQSYRLFVESFLNTIGLRGTQYEGRRGAILFTYASMWGKALTFEEFYADAERDDDVAAIIKALFKNSLWSWLEGAQPNPQSHLYQTYSLAADWDEICRVASDLGFDPDADFLNCLGQQFHNPLKQAQRLFDVRHGRKCETRETISHGDLNSRNILIDGNRNVFVIDFAKTRRSHLLRDFCKLEAEIKFCLTRLQGNADVAQAILLEKELLFANEEPFADLKRLLEVNPAANTDARLERLRRSVVALRQIASQAMSLQVSGLAEQYYLGLLHYTLDTLRYAQCNPSSKLYALISASWLSQALR